MNEVPSAGCLVTTVQLSPLPLENCGERLGSSLAAVISDDAALEEWALSLLAPVAELRIVARRELSQDALSLSASLRGVPLVLVALPERSRSGLAEVIAALPDAVVIGLPAPEAGVAGPPSILRRLALPLGLSLATRAAAPEPPAGRDVPILDRAACKLQAGALSLTLTATQVDLMSLLLERSGEWVSTDELGAHAFGERYAADGSLVRVHLYRLRCRLGPLAPRLRSCRGRGYLFA